MSPSVSFSVPGKCPSKSNFRWSRNDPKAREKWARIKQWETEVGLSAMAAGAKRHMGDGPARLRVLLVNQTLDLDNSLKVLDGLKNVAFLDDSPEHLEAIQVCQTRDGGPARVEYRISWGEDQSWS